MSAPAITTAKPTAFHVATQIAGLERIRDTGQVPEFSLFGDDNYAAIDAQIMVLRDGHDAERACSFCSNSKSQYVTDCAQMAQDWRDGQSEEEPTSGWEGQPA